MNIFASNHKIYATMFSTLAGERFNLGSVDYFLYKVQLSVTLYVP